MSGKSARRVAVARVHEAEDGVRDEPRGREAEEERAVALVDELLQRAVQPDGLLWVVVSAAFSANAPINARTTNRAMWPTTPTALPTSLWPRHFSSNLRETPM